MRILKLMEISTREAQGDTFLEKVAWIRDTVKLEGPDAVRIIHTAGPLLALRDSAATKLWEDGFYVFR